MLHRALAAVLPFVLTACAASADPGGAVAPDRPRPGAADAPKKPAVQVDAPVAVDATAAVTPPPSSPDASAVTRADGDVTLPVDAAAAPTLDAAPPPSSPCPATGPCRILPFGDSIAWGVGSSAGGGYRVPLFRKALAAKRSIVFVGSDANGPAMVDGAVFPRAHEGHRGFATVAGDGREGITPLTAAVMAAQKPHVVLLLIGTNDVGAGIIDPPHAPDRVGALIDKILAADPRVGVIVAQIGPCQDDAINQRIVAFNAGLPAIVKARADAGRTVALVDMYTPFNARADFKKALMFNEFHPNDAGYVLMADAWWGALAPLLAAF